MEVDRNLAEHLAGWGRTRRGWDAAGCLAQLANVRGRSADDVAMAWVRFCADDAVRTPGAFPNLAGPHWSEKVAPPATPGPLKPHEACPACMRLTHPPDDVCTGRPAPAPDSRHIAEAKAAIEATLRELCACGVRRTNCTEHRKPATTEETHMSTLMIYGASDDLIELAGVLRDELDPHYSGPATVVVKVDDTVYTRIVMEFDPDGSGEWRIQPTTLGELVTIVPARGEDAGSDADGCPGYSDKAVIDVVNIEARRINVTIEETR